MIQPIGSNPYRSQPLFGFLPLISTTPILGSYLFNQNQNLTIKMNVLPIQRLYLIHGTTLIIGSYPYRFLPF